MGTKKILNVMGCDLGPTYFEDIANKIPSESCYAHFEWRAKLNSKFVQIKFYGEITSPLPKHYKYGLIAGTDFAPEKVIAIDTLGNEILLFDGCKHGYNAIFCDEYTEEQINQRVLNQTFFPENQEAFEIILSAYYQTDYDEEFSEDIDENQMFNFDDGRLESLSTIKRNGFDVFEIDIVDKTGKTYAILAEELA